MNPTLYLWVSDADRLFSLNSWNFNAKLAQKDTSWAHLWNSCCGQWLGSTPSTLPQSFENKDDLKEARLGSIQKEVQMLP